VSEVVVIDTRRVAGRVRLRFGSLDEMLAHAERLVAGGTKQLGNLSLGQNLQHLALIQNASIDGYPRLFPWPLRILLRYLLKRWMLRNGFPPSGPGVKTLNPEPIDATAALANLRAATDRVKKEAKRSLNPGFGAMSLGEWNLLYLRHAELHLSYCVPLEQVTDGQAESLGSGEARRTRLWSSKSIGVEEAERPLRSRGDG
jgi:Protein of unknown function (DUF1569)